MKTRIKPLLISASGAMIAVLALSFTFGGSRIALAEDIDAVPAARSDMVLVSAKDLEGLEQRVSQLEEIVAALTQSSQHVKTRRLCVSDKSGVETCVTKAQLDALLKNQPHTAEAALPAPDATGVGTPSVKEQTASVPTSGSEPPATAIATSNSEPSAAEAVPTSNPQPSAAAGSNGISPTEPESTGSILPPPAPPAGLAAQPSVPPDSEAAKNDEAQESILTPPAPPAAAAAQPGAPFDSETDDLDLD